MIRVLCCCLAILMLAPLASAETVQINSGEHANFSRLVLRLAEPSEWVLGRVTEGYELRLTRPGITLDAQQVFLRIPRTRIADVTSPDDSRLLVDIADDVHAIAFETQPGTIVLDVVTGAPPISSEFEADLAAAPSETLPSVPPDLQLSVLPQRPRTVVVAPDPRLAVLWSGFTPETLPRQETETAPGAVSAPATDPRVLEAEQQLLLQLGRAASQGLVTMSLPEAAPPATPATPADPDVPASREGAVEPKRPLDHLALQSETVFDRDSPGALPRDALTPIGLACVPDDRVDVASWRGTQPAAVLLGNARSGLLGEFDRPDSANALGLARLYVALGMGAEVATLFDSLAIDLADEMLLRAMAAVLDDLPAPAGSTLGEMAACDSAVAMWALLANPKIARGDPLAVKAVLRGFSALPIDLRRLLGPRLADRLLALGADAAARSIRDAIRRAPGEHGTSLNMIDAGLELAAGAPAEAASALAPVLAGNGPDAPLATIRFVDALLASNASIDLATVEAVAALAKEHRDAADGPELSRAHILAAGSATLFDRAFDALADMPNSASDEFVAATATELLNQLIATPDDILFVTQYFGHRELVLLQGNWPLQVQTAERLLGLGFADEVRRVLGPEAVRYDEGRLLRAQAAIFDGDGIAALAEIAGLSGDEATRLRADALRLTGDHEAARRAYQLIDLSDLAGVEAWNGGNWAEAARLSSAPRQELLAAFGLGMPATSAAPPPDAPLPDAPLANSRALLDQSRAAREVLARVLAEAGPE